MKKLAGVKNVGEEELARVKNQVMTRLDAKALADVLFSNGRIARDKERQFLMELFEQAPGAETSAMLSKEGSAPSVATYFEKKAYLTDAQRRFPELVKVAMESSTAKVPTLKKTVTDIGKGANPVRASLTGGSA